ncbi:MAG: ComEC/Rec2 family competence protein [Pirellula sp.]
MNLEVTVFGGDWGESIVIRFPNGEWGVVDCFASSSDDRSNPALQYLLDQKVSRLSFVCLTHPHEDHYSGILQLIKRIPIRDYLQPAVMTPDRLQQLIERDEALCLSRLSASQGLLFSLYQHLGQAIKKKNLNVIPLVLGTTVRTPEVYGGVAIQAIGPSGNQGTKFETRLSRCFKDSKFDPSVRLLSINQCSTGLSLQYNACKIVLGGDIESGGWTDLLEQNRDLIRCSKMVKVAHHGSKTGISKGLWEAHTENVIDPVAVVTPYHRSQLPNARVLRTIKNYGVSVYIAGRLPRRKDTDTPETGLLKACGAIPRYAGPSGIVKTTIDPSGSITIDTQLGARKLD